MDIKLPDSLTDEQRDVIIAELAAWSETYKLTTWMEANQPSPGWYQRFVDWWYRLVRMWFN